MSNDYTRDYTKGPVPALEDIHLGDRVRLYGVLGLPKPEDDYLDATICAASMSAAEGATAEATGEYELRYANGERTTLSGRELAKRLSPPKRVPSTVCNWTRLVGCELKLTDGTVGVLCFAGEVLGCLREAEPDPDEGALYFYRKNPEGGGRAVPFAQVKDDVEMIFPARFFRHALDYSQSPEGVRA
jgi:hypothetical protein